MNGSIGGDSVNDVNEEDTIREIHERFRQSSSSLNELQRRLWAATEAMKLGWGGITIVSKALRMSRSTIRRGIADIATGEVDTDAGVRVRRRGGGRKAN